MADIFRSAITFVVMLSGAVLCETDATALELRRSIVPAEKAAPPVKKPDFFTQPTPIEQAIRKVLEYEISEPDSRNLAAAIRDIDQRKRPDTRDNITDPTARKLVEWYILRKSSILPSPEKIAAFIAQNPAWPDLKFLRLRAETGLLLSNFTPQRIRRFFKTNGLPQTGVGHAALARAYFDTGDIRQAQRHVVTAWHNYKMSGKAERKILQQMGILLTLRDHEVRLRYLLFGKSGIISSSASRIKKFATLPASYLNYMVLRKLRREGNYQKVKKLWQQVRDIDYINTVEAGAWWRERRALCFMALAQNDPDTAYDFVVTAGFIPHFAQVEAAFLSGWIALRYQEDTATARRHFTDMLAVAKSATQLAKANYWLARASKKPKYAEYYARAAKFQRTYYGQAARKALKQTLRPELSSAFLPKAEDIKEFSATEAVRAILISRQSGLHSLLEPFFLSIAKNLDDAGKFSMLGELTRTLRVPHIGVRIGRIAAQKGMPIDTYSYPVNILPGFRKLNGKPDKALLLSLIRQETEFKDISKSLSGALGLMQIIPKTARAVASKYDVEYQKAKLTANPTYNLMLGSAYLNDLIKQFGGSYPIAIAAYNAGPSKVRKWLDNYGDPRKGSIPVTDWAERIPFSETRRYVQKVLAGAAVYRARLTEKQ
jgi:soluble lytic murein transglycosylase